MTESEIMYYIGKLSIHIPKQNESILNVGSGIGMQHRNHHPYEHNLKKRCNRYVSVDKKEGADVQCDVTEGLPFKDKEFNWAWSSEMIEHISQDKQKLAVDNILEKTKNAIFTYPDPEHPSFDADPEHTVVVIDWNDYKHLFKVSHIKTKTGRNVVILKEKNR